MMFALLVLPSLITFVSATPIENVTEDMKSVSSHLTELTGSSTTRRLSFVDNRHIPQLIFPSCTSVYDSEGLRNLMLHGVACTCDLNTHDLQKRDDYHYTPGIGAHKFHTRGKTFNSARKICNLEGGHLAVIDSIAEEQVLLNLFAKAGPMRNVSNENEAFIGIHDLFLEGDWVTILGDSLHKNGYENWSDRWGGQPDNGGDVQHCGALMKDGAMDDVNCNLHFAFFCEIPGIRFPH